jgi:hypothetical protein
MAFLKFWRQLFRVPEKPDAAPAEKPDAAPAEKPDAAPAEKPDAAPDTKPNNEEDIPDHSGSSMRRLASLAAGGCVVVVIYGLATGRECFAVVSVGLMTACAATLAGGLLGFIFGVPYTRDDPSPATKTGNDSTSSAVSHYRPNTSLEQISDWLTKMLVGVGLVEIKTIPGKLKQLAEYVSTGLGNGKGAQAFAFTALIYFFICGFLFGFLWARLSLRRMFTKADQELAKKLDDKIEVLSKLEADARAQAFVTGQLNRQDEEPATQVEANKVIGLASTPTRGQIFEQVRQVSEDMAAPDYDIKCESVISILKALIASDKRGRYHTTHGELSYALSRQSPPDLPAAEEEISKAIEIRDKRKLNGWQYYEFRRARYRIQQDGNYLNGQPSEPKSSETINSDLKAARGDPNKWERWLKDNKDVRRWLELNPARVD